MLSRSLMQARCRLMTVHLTARIQCRSNTSAVATRPRDNVVAEWENFKMPLAPYEGMGPLPPMPTWDPKCMRHYIFPEYWFEFLHPRTGITGPYVLGLGTAAFLFSKEFYIYTPETMVAGCLGLCMFVILRTFGSSIKEGFQKSVDDRFDAIYRMKMDEIEHIEKQVEEINTEKWRSGLMEMYHDIKKSNLAMMLETEYANRTASLVGAVKKSLNYQVAVQQVDRDLAHSHMVQWIEDKVRKSITPDSQKKTLDVCIAKLNAMTK